MKLLHQPREPSRHGRIVLCLKVGLPALAAFAFVLITALSFGLWTSNGEVVDILKGVCTADGTFHVFYSTGIVVASYAGFRIQPTRYNPYWQSSQLFSITLGFGRFSYTLARGIDVCWDLLIGRGGQVVLSLLAYPVIRRSLYSGMERAPVLVPLYTSIAFEKISFWTLQTIIRNFFRQIGKTESPKRSNFWRYTGFSCILAYILNVPTLASIMTGYQAKWIPYVERPDNHALVKFSDLQTPPLIVKDGERIGLSNDHVVLEGDTNYKVLLAYGGTKHGTYSPFFSEPDWRLINYSACWDASYLDSGSETDRAADTGPDLERDLRCNITYDPESSQWASSCIMLDGKTWTLPSPPLQIVAQTGWIFNWGLARYPKYLSIGKLALKMDDLQTMGCCQPSADYNWGFSSILLFVFSIVSVVFAIILVSLHYESIWLARTGRSRYETNNYRDAVDLLYDLQDNYLADALRNMSAENIRRHCADKVISLEASGLPRSWKDESRRSRSRVEKGTIMWPETGLYNIQCSIRTSFEFIAVIFSRRGAEE